MRKLITILLLLPFFAFSQINDNWDAVKVGTTDMSKIYVGSTLVWQKQTAAETIKNGLIVWGELDDDVVNNYVGSLTSENGTGSLTMDGNNNSFLTKRPGKLGFSIERTVNYAYDAISTSSFYAGDYSISLWFNGDVSANDFDDYLWIFSATSEGARIYPDISGNLILDFFINTSGADYHFYQFTSSVSPNNWHHVVFTRTNSEVNIYIDGTLMGTENSTFLGFSSTLRFDGYTSHDDFKGKYDQIIVWNRAVTQDEVEYINNSNNGRTYSSIP